MPASPACPFCSATNRTPVMALQENPHVALLRCAGCWASSASRMPTAAALDDYYQNYYTAPHAQPTAERVTFFNTRRFGRHLAQRLARYVREPAIRILDFGGGDGAVAVRIAERMIERGAAEVAVTLVDPNRTLCAVSDTRISLDRRDTLDDLPAGGYHMVVASAIIEHVPEPAAILARLVELIAAGGLFYARTPWMVPFIRATRVLKPTWDFTFPAHIHDLGQDFWERYVNDRGRFANLTVVESRPSIVETAFRQHALRTMAAYALKAPWWLLGRRYPFVGGWEIFVRKQPRR